MAASQDDMWGDAADLHSLLDEPKPPKMSPEAVTRVVNVVQRFFGTYANYMKEGAERSCVRRIEALGDTVTKEDCIRIIEQFLHAGVNEIASEMWKEDK